jgi:hypothetical protein
VNETGTLLKVALTTELEKVNAVLTALEAPGPEEATSRLTDRASGREILEEERRACNPSSWQRPKQRPSCGLSAEASYFVTLT